MWSMGSLCETPLERKLKRPFIPCSSGVQDNERVKNCPPSFETPTPALAGQARRALGVRRRVRQRVRRVLRQAACVWLGVCAMALHGSALASSDGDHERALQAVQSGQVLPLTQVLALVERSHPGQVLEVELENHDRQWQYEIKLLQPDGRLLKLKIDARSGSILKRKTR